MSLKLTVQITILATHQQWPGPWQKPVWCCPLSGCKQNRHGCPHYWRINLTHHYSHVMESCLVLPSIMLQAIDRDGCPHYWRINLTLHCSWYSPTVTRTVTESCLVLPSIMLQAIDRDGCPHYWRINLTPHCSCHSPTVTRTVTESCLVLPSTMLKAVQM